MLEEQFNIKVKKNIWWQKNEKVLVAVSGGVDSLALLRLMIDLPESLRPHIFVAHINHQLRDVSDIEEKFVADTCQKFQIPFFSVKWEEGPQVTKNMEQKARDFRYQFFEDVMTQNSISILLTAHHEDDQVETMMMRLINGNRLNTLVGIQEMRPFFNGKLCRPLLTFKKREIYDYMERIQQSFFEDETNQEDSYFRNRLRNKVLPSLREENSKFNEHLLEINQELSLGLSLIETAIQPLYENSVSFTKDSCVLDVDVWQTYTVAEQHFVLTKLVYELENQLSLIISKNQQQAIQDILTSQQPNQQLSLKENWFFEKSYKKASFSQKNHKEKIENQEFILNPGESVFLSESEWFSFVETEEIGVPEKIKGWSKKELIFTGKAEERLLVRKKASGDRFIINEKGQTKKVARYFIDEKIPVNKREKSWVVEDSDQEVKWLLPFRGSYLSIRDETAKIHYKLVYYYLEDK